MINSKIDSFVELKETLQNVVSICRILISVLKDERELLVTRKNGDWDLILECKEKALKNLSQVETEWRAIFKAMALSRGIKVTSYSLTNFFEHLELGEAAALKEVQEELLDALNEICDLNRQNASLLRHALYYNQSFLSLVHSFTDRTKSLIYGPLGQPAPFSIQLVGKRA